MMQRDDMTVAEEIDWLGPQPKRRNGTPELDQQRAVVAWARLVLPVGSKVIHIPSEAKGAAKSKVARMRYGAARKKSGVVTGTPDLVCVLPNGRTAWIEMKAPKKGEVSEEQDQLHADFRAIGHLVGVATSIETARWLFQQWGIPLREAAGLASTPAIVRVAKAKPRLPADAVPF